MVLKILAPNENYQNKNQELWVEAIFFILTLSAVSLLKHVWPFGKYQALKDQSREKLITASWYSFPESMFKSYILMLIFNFDNIDNIQFCLLKSTSPILSLTVLIL